MSFGFGFGFPRSDTVAAGGVPGGGASLRLNFLDSTTLDPRVTFSRTSNATVFDNTGKLIYAPHNLLTNSESFDNVAWVKTSATIAANVAVAPDGTTTADTFTFAGAGGDQRATQGGVVPLGAICVFSVWLRGTAGQTVTIEIDTTAVVVVLTASWARYSVSGPSATTTAVCRVISRSGNTASVINVWGAQLNVANAPGVNLLTFSEEFDNAAWTKTNSSIQSNLLTFSEQFDNAAWAKSNSFIQTNQIRNNTMQGAVAGTPGTLPTNWAYFANGGLTTSVVGTGTQNGISYIDLRLNGTTSSTFAVLAFDATTVTASAGQVWTESFWASLVAGSTANITSLNVNVRQSGGATPTFDTPFVPTASFTRVSGSGTLGTGATGVIPALALFFASGVAIDITLRIGWPQLVLGAVAGDPVPTYGTARAVMYPAPDGSITADKLSEDISAATTHRVGPAASIAMAAGSMFFSVYLKAGERTTAAVNIFNATDGERGVNVDLVAGTITSVSGTVPTRTITAVGDGWYRVAIGVTATVAANTTPLVYINLYGNYTGDGTSGIYIWGAQLVQGTVPYDYVRTDATPVAIGYSAPDATMTADKLVENTATSTHEVVQGAVTVGLSYTVSFYAKAAERNKVAIQGMGLGGAGFTCLFDLVSGTVSNAPVGSQIVSSGGGWYRCSVPFIPTATTGPILRLVDAAGNQSYTGDGVSGVLIWGAQLNLGATALPYVETTNSIYPTPSYNDTTVQNLLGYSQEFDNAAWTKLRSYIQTNLLTFSEQFDNAAWTKTASYIQTNLLTYSQDIDNAAWTKSGSSIQTNLLTYSQQFDNAAWTKTASYIQTNLLTFSEQFDNAAWSKFQSSLAPNVATAPNGAVTADKFVLNGGLSQPFTVTQTITGLPDSATTSFSVYLKAGEITNTVALQFYNKANTFHGSRNLDLSTGALSGTDFNCTTSVQSVGNGWYRLQMTGMSTGTGATTPNVRVVYGGAVVGTGLNGFFIWGAQFVLGSVPGDYQQTLGTAAAVQYLAPDASITADKLGEDTSTAGHQITVAAAGGLDRAIQRTISIYVKAAGRSILRIQDNAFSSNFTRGFFNLATQLAYVTQSGAGVASNAQIVPMGNGWFRCSYVSIPNTTTGGSSDITYALCDTGENTVYTGDGTSGVLLWGAQLVRGASVDTYQETVGAALPIPYTAPDGSRTSEKLVENTATSTHQAFQSQTVTSGLTYTYSVYAKAAERTQVAVNLSSGAGAFATAAQIIVDLTNGTVVSGAGTVVAIADGWYRISVSNTAIATAAADVVLRTSVAGNTSYTGDGSSGLLVWGAQLVQGAVPGDYQVTYGGTSVVGYLAPDATFTADKLVENTAAGQHFVNVAGITTVSGTFYSASIYMKAAERTFAAIEAVLTTGGVEGVFNLTAGTVTLSAYGGAASPTGSITSVGGGWYRCVITFAANGVSTALRATKLYQNSTTQSYTGDGTSGVLIWGAQLVQGAVPGDYQETVATALPVQYVAPDGSVTAEKLVEDTSPGTTHFARLDISVLGGTRYTKSIYFKAVERNQIELAFDVDLGAFDGSTVLFTASGAGTATVITGTPLAYGITAVGNGWYRCWIMSAALGTGGAFFVNRYRMASGGTSTYNGDGTSGILIWGAQISDSASIDPYVYNPLAAPTSTAYYGPRFDYDPFTLAPQGLLIEEQRTNSIRNSVGVGAVAGSPGTLPTNWNTTAIGLTRTVVGTGYENGVSYIDVRFNGTTTGQFGSVVFETITGVAASPAQAWTCSFYARLISGSLTNVSQAGVAMYYRDSGGLYLSAGSNAFVISNTLSRYSFTATTVASTAVIQPGFYFNAVNASGDAIDFTVRIGLPQLELGPTVTSVIPTTTAAATRATDFASMLGANFTNWYSQPEGTMFVAGSVTLPISGTNQFLTRASDNSYNNGNGILVSTTGILQISTSAGGVFDGLAGNFVALPNVTFKTAGAYKTNDLGMSSNGGTVATDPTATIPLVMTRMDLGGDHSGFNRIRAGYIRQITYFPRRLANSELQTVTL